MLLLPHFGMRSRRCLVPDLDKVIAELLDGVGGGTGLDRLWVVCDEDGLGGLDDDHALAALHMIVSVVAVHCVSQLPPSTLSAHSYVCRYLLTFLPYILLSSALSTTNFSPAMCRPVLWTCFTSDLSAYALTTSCISCGETVKPALVAQTLLPSLLKMAALSTLPVPTRLFHIYVSAAPSRRIGGEKGGDGGVWGGG